MDNDAAKMPRGRKKLLFTMWTAKFVGHCLAEQSEVLNTPKSGPN